MTTEFVDVDPENPLDKLPPMRDTQHAIESELEVVTYQLDKEACEVEYIETQLRYVHISDSLTRCQYYILTIRRKERWERNCDRPYAH